MRYFSWMFVVGALAACSPAPPPPVAAGQTWLVHARPADGATTVTILHIEAGTTIGDVAFVSINNAVIALPDKRQTNKIWPVAFALDALKSSLKEFQFNQGTSLGFETHVEAWKAKAASGEADRFTYKLPVAQALDLFERGETSPWAPASR